MIISKKTIGKDLLTVFHEFWRLMYYWGIYNFLNVKFLLSSLDFGNVSGCLHGDPFKWLNSPTINLWPNFTFSVFKHVDAISATISLSTLNL